MKDYISIIIPIYNSEKYLEQCLDSILGQSYTNYEVIIIDDGSTDNSRSIYKRFTDMDKRFTAFYQKNQGVSVARNKGLDIAQGEIILFIDSDDVISPVFLEIIMHIFNEGNDLVCFSATNFVNKTEFTENSNVLVQKFTTEQLIENLLYHRQQLSITRSAFRREQYLDLHFKEELFICEDIIMLLEILVVYKSLVPYIKTELYGYRIHKDSLTHGGKWREKLTGYIAIKTMEYILSNHDMYMEKAFINRKMNLMRLMYRSIPWKEKGERDKAWDNIKKYRKIVILDGKSRRHERLAALISLCGQRVYRLLLRLIEAVRFRFLD